MKQSNYYFLFKNGVEVAEGSNITELRKLADAMIKARKHGATLYTKFMRGSFPMTHICDNFIDCTDIDSLAIEMASQVYIECGEVTEY